MRKGKGTKVIFDADADVKTQLDQLDAEIRAQTINAFLRQGFARAWLQPGYGQLHSRFNLAYEMQPLVFAARIYVHNAEVGLLPPMYSPDGWIFSSEYATIEETIAPQVLDIIATWILKQTSP